jgi:maltose-binding protein MalE
MSLTIRRWFGFLLLWAVIAQPMIAHAQTGSITATITVWHSWTGAEAKLLDSWIQGYQKLHPSTEVVASYVPGDMQAAVAKAAQTARVPDLFVGSSAWAGTLADAQLIAPIGTNIDKAFTEQGTPVAWATVTYNNGIYAIPESAQGLALYYNNALVSKPAGTLDDLLAQKTLFAFDFYTTAGLYLGLGGRLINDGGSILVGSDTIFADYLSRLKGMYNSASGIQTPSPTKRIPLMTDETFRLGSTPYLIDGNWKIADLRQYLGDKLRVGSMPSIRGDSAWQPLVTTTVFYLSANTGTNDLAQDFALYATGNDQQAAAAKVGQVPVNPKAQIDDPVIRGFFDQFAGGIARSPRPEMAKLWPILDDAVYAVTVGGQPVTQALRDTAQKLAALSP